jgi:hypothetical protein
MKLVTIVIRGCLVKVTPEQAREFEHLEREAVREDCATNQLP